MQFLFAYVEVNTFFHITTKITFETITVMLMRMMSLNRQPDGNVVVEYILLHLLQLLRGGGVNPRTQVIRGILNHEDAFNNSHTVQKVVTFSNRITADDVSLLTFTGMAFEQNMTVL